MSGITTHAGDCRDVLANMPADSIDACVTDPPYHLTSLAIRELGHPSWNSNTERERTARRGGFMGKEWDGGDVAFRPETWRAVLRVLKPGAHLVAFGGTRTSHRMVCAIEDAGFEIRDTLCWIYGSGFPKSLDVSKAIDRAAGAEREVVGINGDAVRAKQRNTTWTGDVWGDNGATITAPATDAARQWTGWGTALKPAHEPIVLARKPLGMSTVAGNVLAHGTGALNVDACRIGTTKRVPGSLSTTPNRIYGSSLGGYRQDGTESGHDPNIGRWPANVCHDGSPEVEAAFAVAGERASPEPYIRAAGSKTGADAVYGDYTARNGKINASFGDTGSASRFFYCAKADSADRADSRHPTVKPVDLMRWLVRLITPPGGTVLDPFAGSGTTGEAAMLEGMRAILIEQDPQHVADIRHRMGRWHGADLPLFTSWPPADDPADTLMADLFAGHGT